MTRRGWRLFLVLAVVLGPMVLLHAAQQDVDRKACEYRYNTIYLYRGDPQFDIGVDQYCKDTP